MEYDGRVNNATVTIRRRGEEIDDATGYRSPVDRNAVLEDAPCKFSWNAGTRQSFSAGVREFVKSTPSLVLDDFDGEILPGDAADVTFTTAARVHEETFTVDTADRRVGTLGTRWFLTLSR